MTVSDGIHELATWLDSEVCSKMQFKKPSNAKQTQNYEYALVNPTVHEMYAPPQTLANQLNRDLCPSILVHLLDGLDYPRIPSRDLKFRLLLGVWNPGTHSQDIINTDGDVAAFTPNADGWQDLWNFVDKTLAKLENAEQIGEILRVKAEEGFSYSPYKEDGVIIDFYPYYFATIEFSVAMAQAPPSKYYIENFL